MIDNNTIKEMTYEQCEAALGKILKMPNVSKPLTPSNPLWDQSEELSTAICDLEDRISYLRAANNAIQANASRWAHKRLEVQTPPPDENLDD